MSKARRSDGTFKRCQNDSDEHNSIQRYKRAKCPIQIKAGLQPENIPLISPCAVSLVLRLRQPPASSLPRLLQRFLLVARPRLEKWEEINPIMPGWLLAWPKSQDKVLQFGGSEIGFRCNLVDLGVLQELWRRKIFSYLARVAEGNFVLRSKDIWPNLSLFYSKQKINGSHMLNIFVLFSHIIDLWSGIDIFEVCYENNKWSTPYDSHTNKFRPISALVSVHRAKTLNSQYFTTGLTWNQNTPCTFAVKEIDPKCYTFFDSLFIGL